MAGLERPDDGSLTLFGFDVLRDRAAVRERIAFVPSRQLFEPRWSVRRLAGWTARFHRRWDREALARILAAAAIDDSSRADALSPFQSAMFSLGLGLAFEPRLLVLEESDDRMDADERGRFDEALAAGLTSRPETSTVFARETASGSVLATRLLILHEGRTILAAPLPSLGDRVRRITFFNEGEDARCLEIWFCHKVKIRGRELELIVDDFDDDKWARFIETPGVEEPRFEPIAIEDLIRELGAERKAPGDASLERRSRHVS